MVLAAMAAKELSEDLFAAYLDATERLRIVREDAVSRANDAMSATPGWQAAAKAGAAHAVLTASRVETEALLGSLSQLPKSSGRPLPWPSQNLFDLRRYAALTNLSVVDHLRRAA